MNKFRYFTCDTIHDSDIWCLHRAHKMNHFILRVNLMLKGRVFFGILQTIHNIYTDCRFLFSILLTNLCTCFKNRPLTSPPAQRALPTPFKKTTFA